MGRKRADVWNEYEELDKEDLKINRNVYNAIKFIVLKEKYNEEHKENLIQESEIFDIE